MNRKYIKKLLDSIDEQTMNQIANIYQATDSKTKEKIYQQVCERKKAMNQQEYKISETYHAKNINYMPWTRTFGIATACILVMGGTFGGIWKLTRFTSPSENNNSQTETNITTTIPSVIATETTTFSETSETVQTTTQITSQAMIQTTPEIFSTATSATSTETSIIASTTQTTPITTTITTTVTLPHKETVLSYETEPIAINSISAPVTNSVIETESPVTAPVTETTTTTTTTQTEPITTKPAYLTAYLEICEEYEKDFNNLSYCLYDVDKDGTPELVIHGFSYWISLYTYADNQVYELMDKWAYGINNNMGYCFHPEKNSIYYNVGEYAGLIYHNIYLTITPEHKLVEETILTCVNDADTLFEQYPYLKNDDSHHYINGNGYYLNYEKITEEEYNTFYTENYPTNYNTDLNYQSYSEFSASLSE